MTGARAASWVGLLLAVAAAHGSEPKSKTVRTGPYPLAAAKGRTVEILAYDNGDASPWAEFFAFDSPGHPKLVQLRTEYGLDSVVKGAKTDLERAVALKRWVGAQWKFATPATDAFRDWSAVALLERGKRGQWGWCGQAAMLFQQACLAVGLPARFIELGRESTPACHFTTEVYLREHGKWAVVDATPIRECDVYYTVEGVPQCALEMHSRVARGTMDGVSEVHPDRTGEVGGRETIAWAFYYVRWLTRCDVVTHTPKFVDLENTFDRRWHTVEWVDAQTVPWEKQKHAVSWMRNERLSAWTTSDAEVVSWKPSDRVRMVVSPSESDYVFIQLWSADLDFEGFEVSIDGRAWDRLPPGNTTDSSGPRFGWGAKRFSIQASPGVHQARARLIRRTGTRGPESFVEFRAVAGPAGPDTAAQRLRDAFRSVPASARALVLVDARLDKLLGRELSAYLEAARRRRKFVIARVAIEGLDDVAPAELRSALAQAKQDRPQLEGVLFVGNVKLPSFFMPRPDIPSVRLWPRYYEDLDMVPRRRIAPAAVLHEAQPGQPGPAVAGRKEFTVPRHDFDEFAPGRSPGPELWAAFLPVGFADPGRDNYPGWAEQLKPFFAKALAFYSGKTAYGKSFYLVSNDLGLLERSAAVWRAIGAAGVEFYSINEKGPGAFKGNPAGYVRAPLEKYRSPEEFLAYAKTLPSMDEGWQSSKVFLEHMRSSRRRIVWWNVHSDCEFSLIRSADAAAMENGGLVAMLNGCSVGGFVQPGSSSFVDTKTPPARNVLCSLVYGRSAFVAAMGSVHDRVIEEHAQALLPALYGGGYLGQAHAARLRHQDASAAGPDQLRQFQEILIGDPFLDVKD
jgi:hypothetical protein